jgi:hypothetical protein
LGHYSGLQIAGGEGMKLVAGKGEWMHWYNPKTRKVEDVRAPSTDEEAFEILRGDDINSGAFMAEYDRLRTEEGMGVEQAMIFVGHEFRLRHLRHQPVG